MTGNTDFTTDGILDTTTTLDGTEIKAFDTTIDKADPAMVMMALATYQAIDPNDPAVFSSIIIDGHLRGDLGYDGVVISDSMSAAAVSAYDTTQLGSQTRGSRRRFGLHRRHQLCRADSGWIVYAGGIGSRLRQ